MTIGQADPHPSLKHIHEMSGSLPMDSQRSMNSGVFMSLDPPPTQKIDSFRADA